MSTPDKTSLNIFGGFLGEGKKTLLSFFINLSGSWYWSSTEIDILPNSSSQVQVFSLSVGGFPQKDDKLNDVGFVRAVRDF